MIQLLTAALGPIQTHKLVKSSNGPLIFVDRFGFFPRGREKYAARHCLPPGLFIAFRRASNKIDDRKSGFATLSVFVKFVHFFCIVRLAIGYLITKRARN